MSENKCPFCGEAMITTEDKIMLCENSDCATMFNEWDYPKVAAAMELAGAEVEQEKAVQLAAHGYIKTNYFSKTTQARKRVLEVFNAK